jgi:hypothetical protein
MHLIKDLQISFNGAQINLSEKVFLDLVEFQDLHCSPIFVEAAKPWKLSSSRNTREMECYNGRKTDLS